MSGSLPRYSSGGFGPKSNPLSFSDINRITRATEIVEGMNVGSVSERGSPRSHFFASLVAQAGTFGGLPLWTWSQIGAADGGIVSQEGLLTSDQYEDGQGLAIQFGENASPGDYVLVHELPSADGKRRFGFGGGGAAGRALEIGVPVSVGTNRWRYPVFEGFVNGDGEFEVGEVSGIMWNLYERDPFGHGQSLTYGSGTLSVNPLEGVVAGVLSTVEDGIRVYICDIANPMDPECSSAATSDLPEVPSAYAPVTSSKTYQILTGGI